MTNTNTNTFTPVTYVALYGISYEDDLDGFSPRLNEQISGYLREDLDLQPMVSTFSGTPHEMATEVVRSCDGDPNHIETVVELLEMYQSTNEV